MVKTHSGFIKLRINSILNIEGKMRGFQGRGLLGSGSYKKYKLQKTNKKKIIIFLIFIACMLKKLTDWDYKFWL